MRTALVYALPAAVVASGWMRLESPHAGTWRIVALVALALLPALCARLRLRIAAAVLAALVA
ncbi:MAG: hypothetical protein QOE36_3267, partial [Gaiellaceae bacterium]|nr:hypothetical protein [Gaiellaceae bacterium]